jgi:hypothetical protein
VIEYRHWFHTHFRIDSIASYTSRTRCRFTGVR